jgi:hypothetical protein
VVVDEVPLVKPPLPSARSMVDLLALSQLRDRAAAGLCNMHRRVSCTSSSLPSTPRSAQIAAGARGAAFV